MSFSGLNLASTRLPPTHTKRPKDAYVRHHFGQAILWQSYKEGGRHLPSNNLEPYRLIGDVPMDEILQLLQDEQKPLQAGDDLLDRIDSAIQNTSSDLSSPAEKAMIQFYKTYSTLPNWAQLADLKLGQQVFLAYSAAIGLTLYYRSLVPGFSIPKIAAVLQATKYLAPPSSRERVVARLTDTGAMLAACCLDVQSILPGGEGWKTALRVRVLHAKVRKALLQRNDWKVEELGVPINQEDMAATLLGFSSNALLGIEMILGFALGQKEQLAYLAYWRYLGWLLGVSTLVEDYKATSGDDNLRPLDPCGPGWLADRPDPSEHSRAIFSSIIFHNMYPNELSVKISHHLLRIGGASRGNTAKKTQTLKATQQQHDNWFYYRALQCRRFVGAPLADALQLPLHPVWFTRSWLWVASTVYLLCLRVYTFAALPFSPFRKRIVAWHHKKMTFFFKDYWKSDHEKRISASLQDQNSNNTESSVSACPFAMVASPIDESGICQEQ